METVVQKIASSSVKVGLRLSPTGSTDENKITIAITSTTPATMHVRNHELIRFGLMIARVWFCVGPHFIKDVLQ